MKKNVLFVCIHNSARSQMAEAFLNQICGDEFEAHSAGIEPGKLNPTVVEVMQEVGIDISGNQTKSVAVMLKSSKLFAYIITPAEVKRGKPAPDMFLLAAKRMGVAPGGCLVFEDGEPGLRAARAAGMASVFVPSRRLA